MSHAAPVDVAAVLRGVIAPYRLLDHPFYRRWEAGQLQLSDLARYAEQYRWIEAALPEVLAGIVAAMPAGRARDLVSASLDDERGRPRPHLELFGDFAEAVGASPDVPAWPATRDLLATYAREASAGPLPGLAAIAAYEVQAAKIASAKAAGLRAWYCLDGPAVAFWDVHAAMEVDHGTWVCEALADLVALGNGDASVVSSSATAAAAAWWGFLDAQERAVAPVG